MFRPARCSFIPPHALDALARSGIAPARASIRRSKAARQKRLDQHAEIIREGESVTGRGGAAAQAARREVYDCKQTWSQHENLVRGENDQPTNDPAADAAFDFAGTVRQYLGEILGRNSIDGAGMNLILNVHYGVDYMNAFWDGDEMTFGDGDGEIFTAFSRSLDVVAHELAHGVTQFTAALDYYSQSGALNEHFSDVFGSAITQFAEGQDDPEKADWLIGDEIMGPELYGETLRSMRAPGTAYDNRLLGKDPQPAHMKNYFEGPEDNRGVHINSGIPNRAFSLVAQEIGTEKATAIWFDALQKLWSSAMFNDAVEVLVESARRLVKEGAVQPGATQTVRSAFRSVGLPS